MVSAKMFVIQNASVEDFKRLKDYSKKVDEIPQFELELKDTVENFNFNADENEISFEFQSDFKSSKEIRGKTIPYVFSYKANIWCWFTPNGNYMLIFGNNEAVKYISGKLEKIVNQLKLDNASDLDNVDVDARGIKIQKLRIDTETLLRIVQSDFIRINSSWWKKIEEEVKSAFLSGRLKKKERDNRIDENEIYREIESKAKEITSVNFLSEKLGHNVVISRKQGSFGVMTDKVQESDLVKYFKEKIYPHISNQPESGNGDQPPASTSS